MAKFFRGVVLKDNSVQLTEEFNDVLLRPSFKVNMRMLKSSRDYMGFIYGIKHTMTRAFHTKYEDYDKLYGISGPNLGIPLQIIAFRIINKKGKFVDGLPEYFTSDEKTPDILFMLNPEIIDTSLKYYETESNCGSLILDKPIKVRRFAWVVVRYNTFHDEEVAFRFEKPVAGTIQHEIDHLNGLNILNRQVKTDEAGKS